MRPLIGPNESRKISENDWKILIHKGRAARLSSALQDARDKGCVTVNFLENCSDTVALHFFHFNSFEGF